jgi:hypothetical protein
MTPPGHPAGAFNVTTGCFCLQRDSCGEKSEIAPRDFGSDFEAVCAGHAALYACAVYGARKCGVMFDVHISACYGNNWPQVYLTSSRSFSFPLILFIEFFKAGKTGRILCCGGISQKILITWMYGLWIY